MTPFQQFEALIQAAKNCGSPMREQALHYWAEGLLWHRGEPLLPVTLTFVPGCYMSDFCIQGTVADRVCRDSREFHALLHRANAAVKYARAVFCDEEHVVIVRTNLDFSARSGPDPDQVKRRFADMIHLIRHEALDSAVTCVQARRLTHQVGDCNERVWMCEGRTIWSSELSCSSALSTASTGSCRGRKPTQCRGS